MFNTLEEKSSNKASVYDYNYAASLILSTPAFMCRFLIFSLVFSDRKRQTLLSGLILEQRPRCIVSETRRQKAAHWAAIKPRLDRNIVLLENEKRNRTDS